MESDDALRGRALALDAADPLASFRPLFLGTDDASVPAYLDGNSLGRPLRATVGRMQDFITGQWGGRLIRGWDEGWLEQPVRLGDRLGAAVLGAAPGQTIVADSTTVLLYKLARAAVDAAAATSAAPVRNRIVVDRQNFPSDRFVVEGIAAERGLEVDWLDVPADGGPIAGDLAGVLGPRTALVLLSHVAYRSGHLADMNGITAVVHDAGAVVLWDLCHSAGVVPVELDAWQVDLAVGCSYKYLNGGPGAPAWAYVRRGLQDSIRQPIQGWLGSADPFEMGQGYRPAPGIRAVASGTPPILGMLAMTDMLELLEQAGIGAIRDKSIALTEYALDLVDELLVPLGVTVSSPRLSAGRGSHITIDHPSFRDATRRLWQRGVIPDFRPPHGIRLGMSPLSTSFAEVYLGVRAVLDELEAAVPR